MCDDLGISPIYNISFGKNSYIPINQIDDGKIYKSSKINFSRGHIIYCINR